MFPSLMVLPFKYWCIDLLFVSFFFVVFILVSGPHVIVHGIGLLCEVDSIFYQGRGSLLQLESFCSHFEDLYVIFMIEPS